NGFWDDFVPVDEAIRYYNKVRTDHPETPIAMFFGDVGHPRASRRDEPAEVTLEGAWLDYYVRGVGSPPPRGVTAYRMTCPTTAPTAGPYRFPSYAAMQFGEIRLQDQQARVIQPTGTEDGPSLSEPLATSCTKVDASDNPATANYRTDPATEG